MTVITMKIMFYELGFWQL